MELERSDGREMAGRRQQQLPANEQQWRRQQQQTPISGRQLHRRQQTRTALLWGLVIIITILLITPEVWGLRCYQCSGEPNNTYCSRPRDLINCSQEYDNDFGACLTTVSYKAGSGLSIIKRCTLRPCENKLTRDSVGAVAAEVQDSRCAETSGAGTDSWQCYDCCFTDGCNWSRAAQPRRHTWHGGITAAAAVTCWITAAVITRISPH